MRLITYSFLIGLFAVMVLAGCNSAELKSKMNPVSSASPAASLANDGVRRITPAELSALLGKNQAVVIDVRNEASYNAGHIRGAKLIPEADIPNRVKELPKDKLIVTYCS